MSTKLVFELKSSLLSTGLLQPISDESDAKSISILCRGVPGQDKAWLRTMEDLLSKEIGPSLHVCKRFVSKGGKMAFGWHIAVNAKTSKELKKFVGWLAEYFATVKPELTVRSDAPSEEADEEDIERAKAAKVVARQPKPVIPKGMPPPRLPEGGPGLQSQPPPPSNFKFALRQIDRETTEIPLPHVYRELNVPNEKERGAKYINRGK